MEILGTIDSPEQIKALNYGELETLAAEVRKLIVGTASVNGGHVAPSLGVVELTLALHYVFNSPSDKIVWDVGHQCYAHKIITGRRHEFSTLRTFGGIAGFPKISESIHDAADTGHSSTSISIATGLAVARDLNGEAFHVIPVIGDGALTGGLAFEGLNNIGHMGLKNLIVILNDNEMSIAPNVGALSSYLTHLRTEPVYSRFKGDVEETLRNIPLVGDGVVKFLRKIKDGVRNMVVPGALFEALGFKYVGPVDGHDIRELIWVLKYASEEKVPVLVHVLTKKGKGYLPAENDPSRFHGLAPFDLATGEAMHCSAPTFTKAFGEAVVALAEEDKRIFSITAAMPDGTGLNKFAARFSDRFCDVGICEGHAVTFAAGLALGGLRPVVAIYSSFLQRAYDQIIHDVALPGLPVIFAIDRAGLVGEDGPTHHGVFDIPFLRTVPGMTIMAPADLSEVAPLLATAMALPGPSAIRYPRGSGAGESSQERVAPIKAGLWQVRRRGGKTAILAVGPMVGIAELAVPAAEAAGLDPWVVNCRFIKPLDLVLLEEIFAECTGIVTVEEGAVKGGFTDAILEAAAAGRHDCTIESLGVPDSFIPQGTPARLRELIGLTPEGILEALRRVAEVS